MGKKQSKKLDPEVLGDLLKHTNFDERELKSWYKGFLKDCPTGYLTKQQFILFEKESLNYMCGINNIFLFENLSLDGVPTPCPNFRLGPPSPTGFT